MARKTARKAPAPQRKAARKPPKKTAPRLKKTRDGGPAGWPTLSTYMTVRDGERSIAFYAAAFGFKLENEPMRDPAGRVTHAGMRLGEAAIMFAPVGMSAEMRPPVDGGGRDNLSLYVYVPDVDALAARARKAGAQVLQAPADQFWGDRICICRDPDGYHWTFATHIGGFTPPT